MSLDTKYADMNDFHMLLDAFKINKTTINETKECKKRVCNFTIIILILTKNQMRKIK